MPSTFVLLAALLTQMLHFVRDVAEVSEQAPRAGAECNGEAIATTYCSVSAPLCRYLSNPCHEAGRNAAKQDA